MIPTEATADLGRSSAPRSAFSFRPPSLKDLGTNALAGLTVSFVAISLGAAFGLASGREDGAFIGILSAGVIALITAVLGGTRIQCSGPTAPMTAVTAVIVTAVATGGTAQALAEHGVSGHLFINQVFILSGVLLVFAGVFGASRLIGYVPKLVISGFMNGIAVLILVGEVGKLFGLFGRTAIGGGFALNLGIALGTCALCFAATPLVQKALPKFLHFLPGALIAIIVATAAAAAMGLTSADVAFVSLVKVESFAEVAAVFDHQVPQVWSADVLWLALPFAANLVFLCYLDTLLTALVVDKMATRMFDKKEETNKGKELVAQGVANAAVSLFGGIPGAQATIRSVLILNEGGTLRLAGVMVGVFVLVEMLLFQGMLELIPQAVFSGVLLKVAYDVMDWEPIVTWATGLKGSAPPRVSHPQLGFIAVVTAVTVLVNLNAAVIGFSALFLALWRTPWALNDLDLEIAMHDGAEIELETGTAADPEDEASTGLDAPSLRTA